MEYNFTFSQEGLTGQSQVFQCSSQLPKIMIKWNSTLSMTLVIKWVMKDIQSVSDLNGCSDHIIVWEGLEDMEEMFTEGSEVIAEWLKLISGAGNNGNKGMALSLAESNMQCKSHACYQVKCLGFTHKEDQHIMFSPFLAESIQSMLNNVCASEISSSISNKVMSKIPLLFT